MTGVFHSPEQPEQPRSPRWSLQDDLDAIHSAIGEDWQQLVGARIFMTGGTGFLGRWMLEALREADRRRNLGVRLTVLTRDPRGFAQKAPHLAAYPAFEFVQGDMLGGAWLGQSSDRSTRDEEEPYSHILHAATDASAHLNEHDPRCMFDTIVSGTRAALELARKQQNARFFLFSSGAVYGVQPWEVTHINEEFRGAPDCRDPRSAYGEGKRAAEMLTAIYARQFGLDGVTARIFAVLGPMLSLDIHFAAGNFIRDVLAGKTVVVQSSGEAVRSLLYAADLTVWLWKAIICAPRNSVYNIGSEQAISVADLAKRTSRLLGGKPVQILGQADAGWNPGRYVPSTSRIRKDLELDESTGLDEAIRRTAWAAGWKGEQQETRQNGAGR